MKRMLILVVILTGALASCDVIDPAEALSRLNTPTPTIVSVSTFTPTPALQQKGGSATAEPPSLLPTPTAEALLLMTCRVNTGVPDGMVWVRACPSTNCPQVGVAREGDTFRVIATRREWGKIAAGRWITLVPKFVSCLPHGG